MSEQHDLSVWAIGVAVAQAHRAQAERDDALARNAALVVEVRDACLGIIQDTSKGRMYHLDLENIFVGKLLTAIRERIQITYAPLIPAALGQADLVIASLRALLGDVHSALETQPAHACTGTGCPTCGSQTSGLRNRIYAASEAI